MTRQMNANYQWIGTSAHSDEIRREIDIASKNDEYVLITGETGVGKEVIARRIHKQSGRADNIFLPVNCGSIPKELAETEFFGNVRGAFTGAEQTRKGYVQAAHAGVLFLDEIGTMPQELQPKFLRFLEDGVVIRVGSTAQEETDVRIIAATNEDIYGSSIRRDLFYRLDVNHIHVKPLRERREDIRPLAEFYLDLLNARNNTTRQFSPSAMTMLQEYEFQGNVRELENIVRYGFFRCENGVIEIVNIAPKIERNRKYGKK